MATGEQMMREALQSMERFPFGVGKWMRLDPGTQGITLVNVIEAYSALGFGAAEPRLRLLLDATRWDIDVRDTSQKNIREWFEPTLLRLRIRNALGLGQVVDNVDSIMQAIPRFRNLMPCLVAMDTMLHPNVLERRSLTQEELETLRQTLLRILESQSEVRSEDLLYLCVLKRRLPALGIPLGQPEADAVADIAARAIESPDRGRVRTLSFVCEGLGRLGGYQELIEQVFEALAMEVNAGALDPTDHFLENHETPRAASAVS